VIGFDATLADVDRTGIEAVTLADIAEADAAGEVVRLVARAVPVESTDEATGVTSSSGGSCCRSGRDGGSYILSVGPARVAKASFLGGCVGTDMGIEITTDIFEMQSFKTNETGVTPTAAAMLRDFYSLVHQK
jgi:homoserine dehydrogenase